MAAPGATCVNHPSSLATDNCSRCGDFICGSCIETKDWEVFCPNCHDRVEKHTPRATTALVMAILSLNGCLFLGIPAMILGYQEMKAVDAGEAPAGGRNIAKGAFILGIITTVIMVLVIIGVLLAVVAGGL